MPSARDSPGGCVARDWSSWTPHRRESENVTALHGWPADLLLAASTDIDPNETREGDGASIAGGAVDSLDDAHVLESLEATRLGLVVVQDTV
jgi:hypothetical protein